MELLCLQAFVYGFFQKRIYNGNNGDEYQHTDDAEQTAADGNRRQYPDRGKPDRAADHFGIDEIALHLLQNEKHHDEGKCLLRADSQYQERTHCTADECPENGDQCRKRDQHPYQKSEGEAEDRHGDEEHQAENDCLQALPCEEITEDAIAQRADAHNGIRMFFFQKGIEQLDRKSVV